MSIERKPLMCADEEMPIPVRPWEHTGIPPVQYLCANKEGWYIAENLVWVSTSTEKYAGWYCRTCAETVHPTLAQELRRRARHASDGRRVEPILDSLGGG